MTRGLSIYKLPQSDANEPVSIDELKRYLKIDSDDHDEEIYLLIQAAREEVESYTGLSLIKTNVIARWESLDSAELPFGPVNSITSTTNKDGEVVTDLTVEGVMGGFVSIKSELNSPTTFTYIAGYDPNTIPQALKLAIMKAASDNFEQRLSVDVSGKMNTGVFANNWKSIARKFSRRSCWE